MAVKKTVKKSTASKTSQSNKVLDSLKESINKRYADIEHNFYLIGIDLIKVNMYVSNFRKWVKENTNIDVSTAYTLMRLVKRDKELADSKKYKTVRPQICLTKLIRLLKYPADFVDQLDFSKEYEAPGGRLFTLIDMPTDLFTEAIENEYRVLTMKDKNSGDENQDGAVPLDKVIITQAKSKLEKLFNDLQTIFTVLSEVTVSKDSKEAIDNAIEELESINNQAKSINSMTERLVTSLRSGKRRKR